MYVPVYARACMRTRVCIAWMCVCVCLLFANMRVCVRVRASERVCACVCILLVLQQATLDSAALQGCCAPLTFAGKIRARWTVALFGQSAEAPAPRNTEHHALLHHVTPCDGSALLHRWREVRASPQCTLLLHYCARPSFVPAWCILQY